MERLPLAGGGVRLGMERRLIRNHRNEINVETHPEMRMAIQTLERPIPQTLVKR